MTEVNLKNGDKVLICNDGKTIIGHVEMISKNQVSALIFFDGMIGGHVGAMPVTRHDRALGIYRSIIDGTTEVTLRPMAAKQEGNGNGETT